MIRRIRLQGWRSFDELDLTFDDGVTFIVSENGVGKTSLIQAAAWALYGDRSGVDGIEARRKDSGGPASVTVDVDLPDGRTLTVRRTVSGAKSTVSAELDGAAVDAGDLDAVLLASLGADPNYLARVTVLPTDLLRSYADETFQLRRHLCRVFGVESLEVAIGDVKKQLSQIDKDTKRFRTDLRSQIVDEAALAAELADAIRGIDEFGVRRDELQLLAAEVDAAEASAAAIAEARAANALRTQRLRDLQARIENRFSRSVEAVDDFLAAEGSIVVAALDAKQRALSAAKGRLDAIAAARAELEAADAACPVCLRPLTEEARSDAAHAHTVESAALGDQIRQLEAELTELTNRRASLRDFEREFESLPAERPVPDVEPHAGGHGSSGRAELQADAARISEELGALRLRRKQLEDLVEQSTHARTEQHVAVALYRREAVATATQIVLDRTVRALLETRVEPVARAVTDRWKQIFGERGALLMTPDGELSLVRGSVEIPFEAFSAGEKVVALLTSRLLIVSASTRASFMWLDEPLEHLDPSNRRIVATMLSSVTSPIKQVLVTTYEEPLARRLAEQIPGVHLKYLTNVPRPS